MTLSTTARLGISGGRGGPWYRRASLKLNGILPTRIDDFRNNRYLNTNNLFPFTAVRSTSALQYDAQGRLVWNPQNQLTRSGTATAVVGAPGTAPTGWTMALGASNGVTRSIIAKGFQDGIEYLDVQLSGTFTAAENLAVGPAPGVTTIIAQAGQSWCASLWWTVQSGTLPAPATAGINGARIRYGSPGLLAQNGDSDTPRTVWGRVSNTRTAPASTTVVGLDFTWSFAAGQAINCVIRIGGFQLELADATTPKAYIETTGSAIFQHRLDFTPAAGPARGLTIEPARTNDITNSQSIALANAGSDTAGSSYLGGWAFRRYTANGASAIHTADANALTPGASQARRVSVIVRAVSGTRVQVTTSTAHAPNTAYVNVNLSTGTILATGAGATDVGVQDLGGGLWRIGFNYTTIASPTSGAGVQICTITSDTDLRAPTNTSSDIFDVAFFENCAGSGTQSPIPTFGAAATRGQDTLNAITGLGALFPAGMTLYLEYASMSSTSAFPAVVCAGDGIASGDEFTLFEAANVNPTLEIKDGGVNVNTATALGTGVRNTFYKIAATCGSGTNANRAVRNGGAVTSKTPTSFPTLNRISYGNFNARAGSTTVAAGMWIREVRIYPATGASDAQLQTLTT